MKRALITATFAAALVAVSPAAAQQSATPRQAPAPITRTAARSWHPAAAPARKPAWSGYQESFAVTYSQDGKPQRVAPKTSPAARAAAPRAHTATTPGPRPPGTVAQHTVSPLRPATPAVAPVAKAGLRTHPASTPSEPSVAGTSAAHTTALADKIALPPAPFNRTTVVIDPAHGGNDNGSRISDSILEKDVTLALALKLRSLLQARGFTVVMTRDSDSTVDPNNPAAQLTLDTRAGIANGAHPVACLLLHATGSGVGVHLYRSELAPLTTEPAPIPWLTAQAAWVSESSKLADKLSQAINRGSLPLVSSSASVRPMDSLTCPAAIVEIAPKESGDPSSLSDESYLQSVADPIASALVFWKTQAQPPSQQDSGSTSHAKSSGHTVTTP